MARKPKTTELEDGQPFVIDPAEDTYIHICCDCNLTHRVEPEVTDDGRILFRWFRDNRRTAALRRKWPGLHKWKR